MRITAKEATPEQVEAFVQQLANALKRPIFRWKQEQGVWGGTVLEFDADDNIENAQKVVVELADLLDVGVWFWTYKTTRKMKTI